MHAITARSKANEATGEGTFFVCNMMGMETANGTKAPYAQYVVASKDGELGLRGGARCASHTAATCPLRIPWSLD